MSVNRVHHRRIQRLVLSGLLAAVAISGVWSTRCQADEERPARYATRSDLPPVVDPPPAATQAPILREEASADPVVDRARELLQAAVTAAVTDARHDRGWRTLVQARDLIRFDPQASVELTSRVLEIPQETRVADAAYWIRGAALAALEDYEGALEAWESVGVTPAADYLELHVIQALLAAGQAPEALRRAEDLVESLEDTGYETVHRAREIHLGALLEAHRWRPLVREGEAFLEDYPDYRRLDRLWWWLGLAELHLGDPTAAAGYFDRVVWNYPYRPVAHQALWTLLTLRGLGVRGPSHSTDERFERARNLRINKHWQIAHVALTDLLTEVLADGGESRFANEIRMELWQNAYGANDYRLALGYLEEILANGSQGVRTYTLLTNLSDTHARLGQHEQGVEAVRRRDRGRSTVHLHSELARYYLENGFFTEALEHTREVLPERRRHGWDYSLLLFLAGDHAQAAVGFEELAEHGSQWTEPGYRYWQARALRESGDLARATEQFEQTHQRWPLSYYGLQAENRLWEIINEPPFPSAVSDILVVPPDTGQAWDSATDDRQPGDPATLHELASRLVRDLNVTLTRFVYREVSGRSEYVPDLPSTVPANLARIYWDGPTGVPDSYVAYRASGHEIESAYLAPRGEEALVALSEQAADLFPSLPRAAFLYSVGEYHAARMESREASIEFRALERSFQRHRPTRRPIRLDLERYAHLVDRRSDPAGTWGIDRTRPRYPIPRSGPELEALTERHQAIYERRFELREDFLDGLMVLGDYPMVRRFIAERLSWDSSPPLATERESWSVTYPRAYPRLVAEYSGEYGVNPYIIWSLMAVESSFNPDSISRSDARGLLQVIPKTGELIAQRLGRVDFGPDDLLEPETSIEFGCYYFSELLTKFNGQELLAFAAYNGGPHNMARWLEGWGDLPLDALVELIPREQPREYVKKVFRHLALYRLIYLGESSLYVGQGVDPSYHMNIHF